MNLRRVWENIMQHRGSSDSREAADSHCEVQGSRNEMEMSRQHSSRNVLLIWLVELQERVKRVDNRFVRDKGLCLCTWDG
jgi:hypothetical protein